MKRQTPVIVSIVPFCHHGVQRRRHQSRPPFALGDVQGFHIPHCTTCNQEYTPETCMRHLGRADEHLDRKATAGEGRWVPFGRCCGEGHSEVPRQGWVPWKGGDEVRGAAAGLHHGTEEEDRRSGHVAEAAHRSPHSRKGASEVAPNLSTPGLRTTRFNFPVDSLRKDLNFNSFAAQKICDLRDALLC